MTTKTKEVYFCKCSYFLIIIGFQIVDEWPPPQPANSRELTQAAIRKNSKVQKKIIPTETKWTNLMIKWPSFSAKNA